MVNLEAEDERADWPDPVETEPPFAQVSLTKLEQMRAGGNLLMPNYIQILLDDNKKTYRRKNRTIRKIPDHMEFEGGFVDDNNGIYVPKSTYQTAMENLRKFANKHGKYKLFSYSGDREELILRYQFDSFKVYFYCSDGENALEKVSQSKCNFETTTQPQKETTSVVCPI